MKIDDIVMIKDEDEARNHWKIGRVIETNSSTDGKVRKVKVQLAEKELLNEGKNVHDPRIFERPIHELVLLLENDG